MPIVVLLVVFVAPLDRPRAWVARDLAVVLRFAVELRPCPEAVCAVVLVPPAEAVFVRARVAAGFGASLPLAGVALSLSLAM